MSLSTLTSADRVWVSPQSIQIPSTDVLTFAFANLDRYDNNSPIFVDAKDPTNRISAKEALQTVRKLIKGLKELGLKEGECVCLHAYNNIWYPLIWLAVIGAGGCITGSNPGYTSSELVHQIKLTKARFIFAQIECMELITEAASECNIHTSNIFFIGPLDAPQAKGCRSWQVLLIEGECDWSAATGQDGWDQQRTAVYGMTSGTTGPPKAAMIPHRYIVAQTAELEHQFRARPYQPSQLICLPVFHAFASPLALVLPLRLGLPTFFLPKWSLLEVLRGIHTYSITDIPVSPPIVAALSQIPDSDRRLLHSLRFVVCAGSALPQSVQSKLYKVLPPEAVVSQCWGTTEAGWHTLFTWQEKDTSGSVGRLLPNVQLKLVDEDGNSVSQDDSVGEAFVLTPMMFSGYLGNPDANKDAFDSDGFYRTGDSVYVQNNMVYYNERIKETMKVRGWQVSPTEIEGVLLEHPQISDVAVIGVQGESKSGLLETLPTAYIVRSHHHRVDSHMKESTEHLPEILSQLMAQEVKEFVAARLISYKHLTGGVIFVKKIPRSPSGKILRRNLSGAELDIPN